MTTKKAILKLIDAIKKKKSEGKINLCADIIEENIADPAKQTPFYSFTIETISFIVR